MKYSAEYLSAYQTYNVMFISLIYLPAPFRGIAGIYMIYSPGLVVVSEISYWLRGGERGNIDTIHSDLARIFVETAQFLHQRSQILFFKLSARLSDEFTSLRDRYFRA